MVRGTDDGNIAEINFVKKFNYNKEAYIDSYLQNFNFDNINNIYMVRVTTKQFSKLSHQVVMTRADAYLIYTNSTKLNTIIKENDFYLDEDILNKNNIEYTQIKLSGISIKMSDSNHFQILKLTPDSFYSLFRRIRTWSRC